MNATLRQRLLVWTLLASVTASLSGGLCGSAWAHTAVVPIQRIQLLQKIASRDTIVLPTVRSQQVFQFTKPKTWALSGASYVEVHFQHSHELLPNRSWLQVLINDRVAKHIPLTKENAEGSIVRVPLGALKDYNTLTFRVEQHYTDRCEDPLDPSLWTQVLPATRLVFDYTPSRPGLDLAGAPYPLIDPLSYAVLPIRVGVGSSVEAYQALAGAAAFLGQYAPKMELPIRSGAALSKGGHGLLVGTPAELPDLSRLPLPSGLSLSGGRWTYQGQPVAENAGVIAMVPHPSEPGAVVLVLSGNSAQGVRQAGAAFASRPKPDLMKGPVAIIPGTWAAVGERPGMAPAWVDRESKTLADLGFPVETVEKINAPPITYPVSVVSQFLKPDQKLWLDVVYSYSPGLNPRFSSLEFKLNDRSIGQVPLQNEMGENQARFTVPLPTDLLNTRAGTENRLVAQFHMLPDKYGFCVDNYIDEAWGKIHDNTTIRVEGSPGSRLPDLGLLNPKGFPFTRKQSLAGVTFRLPAAPSAPVVDAMLAASARLGRASLTDIDVQPAVVLGNAGSLPAGQDVLWFADQPLSEELQKNLRLKGTGADRRYTQPNGAPVALVDLGHGASVEQILRPDDAERVLTVLSGRSPDGWRALADTLTQDARFEKLTQGTLKQWAASEPMVNTALIQPFDEAQTGGGPPWYLAWLDWPWVKPVLIGLAALFAVAWMRRRFRPKRPDFH